MDTRTFRAPTMEAAARQVRTELGMNAMILGTRTIQKKQWLGFRTSEEVEITAAPSLARQRRPAAAAPQPSAGLGLRGPVARQVPAPQMTALPRPTAYAAAAQEAVNPRALLQTPVAQQAAYLGLQQEMCGLKQLVKDLVTQVRHQKTPQVPEDLFDHYMRMVENAVAEEIAAEVIDAVKKANRPENLRQEDVVRQKLCEKLTQLIPACGPIRRTKTDGSHVVALVGPTGVGKTTTIAKLAADLSLRQGRSVGLITIDTYRIAAIEQLRKYAELIRAPLEVVHSPDEMSAALGRLRGCDFVLIDTAGRSPKDALKLNELRDYMDRANPDEIHLVVSSTCCESGLELATQKFADVRWDKIIFTKLDEAAQVGVVFNLLRKVNKGLSYVTTGQAVPDDIEVGQGRRLAEMVLGIDPAAAANGSTPAVKGVA